MGIVQKIDSAVRFSMLTAFVTMIYIFCNIGCADTSRQMVQVGGVWCKEGTSRGSIHSAYISIIHFSLDR